MMLLSMLLMAAAPTPGSCLDPDDSTPLGETQLARGAECKKRVPFPPGYFRKPGALPPAKQVAIKKYFDAKFYDGQSIRWKWPAQGKMRDMYCGWMNAKNRMGAYTGWRPFYVSFGADDQVDMDSVKEDGRESVFLETMCNGDGYDISTVPID